jgi:hypothetical protein
MIYLCRDKEGRPFVTLSGEELDLVSVNRVLHT